MKKISFLIIIILFSLSGICQQLSAQAQSITTNAQYKSGPIELNKFISKKFGEEKKKYDVRELYLEIILKNGSVIDNIRIIGELLYNDEILGPKLVLSHELEKFKFIQFKEMWVNIDEIYMINFKEEREHIIER